MNNIPLRGARFPWKVNRISGCFMIWIFLYFLIVQYKISLFLRSLKIFLVLRCKIWWKYLQKGYTCEICKEFAKLNILTQTYSWVNLCSVHFFFYIYYFLLFLLPIFYICVHSSCFLRIIFILFPLFFYWFWQYTIDTVTLIYIFSKDYFVQ